MASTTEQNWWTRLTQAEELGVEPEREPLERARSRVSGCLYAYAELGCQIEDRATHGGFEELACTRADLDRAMRPDRVRTWRDGSERCTCGRRGCKGTAHLTSLQAEAVWKIMVEGYSVREWAEERGVYPTAVYQSMREGVGKIAKLLS